MNLYKKITKIMVLMIAFAIVVLNASITSAAPEPNLAGSCSVNMTQILQEESVTWSVNATGGLGGYTYSWSGDDGLTGSSDNLNKTYNNPGFYNAEVVIFDGTDEITVECDEGVLSVAFLEFQSCEANEIAYTIGYGPTHWFANITGGIGPYTIDWSGDDDLTGTGVKSDDITYTTAGEKNATITKIASSDGQFTIFESPKVCSPNVMVYAEAEPPQEELTISCSANKSTVKTGEEVTWTAEINGGEAPYTINWNGSEELSGSDEQASITYSTEGTKTASVMIFDSAASPTMRNTSCGNVEVDDSYEEEETSSGSGSSSGGSSGSIITTTTTNNEDDDQNDTTSDSDDEVGQDDSDDLDEVIALIQTMSAISNQNETTETAAVVTSGSTDTGESSDESQDEVSETELDEELLNDSESIDSDVNLLAAVVALPLFGNISIFWLILSALIAIGLIGFLIWKKKRNK